jgi:hypothetical protein
MLWFSRQVSCVLERVQRLDMVENSSNLCKSSLGQFFVSRESRQAISPWNETPSNFCCWHFDSLPAAWHSSSIRPSWRSSGNGRQGVREHLPSCPSSMGSAGSHRRCTVLIALGQQLAPSFSRLHEPHPQRKVQDAQHDHRRATTRDGPTGVEQASPSPRCDEPTKLFHAGWSVEPARYKRCLASQRGPIPVRWL